MLYKWIDLPLSFIVNEIKSVTAIPCKLPVGTDKWNMVGNGLCDYHSVVGVSVVVMQRESGQFGKMLCRNLLNAYTCFVQCIKYAISFL